MPTRSSLLSKFKFPLLVLGDVLFFYIALALTLYIRYGEINFGSNLAQIHIEPFSIALIVWLLVFYSGGLYDNIALKNRRVFVRRFLSSNFIGGIFLILLLYFVPVFSITPKLNFFIFLGLFLVLGFLWRIFFSYILRVRVGLNKKRVLFIGDGKTLSEIAGLIEDDPHLGYEVIDHISWKQDKERALSVITSPAMLHTIVVPHAFYRDSDAVSALYSRLLAGTEVVTIPLFYERLFGRVSLTDIDETWLLQNLPDMDSAYSGVKYLAEILLGLLAFLFFLPLMVLLGLLVVLTSSGGPLYIQRRVGYQGREFSLYKFRSMYNSKEKNPDAAADTAIWSSKDDPRVTPVGKFLRLTHLDELPQLFNVVRGEMSFVGPRPERPVFTKDLQQEVPYYNLRNLAKPGITGWAQIRYPYGASVEDAYKKHEYDLYYLKHRSLLFDISIVLKTIKKFVV